MELSSTMPTTRMPLMREPIRAWIFDWDGIFVDSESWKAWTYGLGLCDVHADFGSLAASHFDLQQPRADDPFLQVCGRFVGKSREEYARGVLATYDALDYRLSEQLARLAAHWTQSDPDRLEQIARERKKTGIPLNAPTEPWEILFEIRRPYYQRYEDKVEPIMANVEFLDGLAKDIPVGLVTRTPEDRVRALMERFGIPAGRFGMMTCIPQKDVSKSRMYEDTARSLGIRLEQCAAVEDTETGVAEARKAGAMQGQRMGLIVACPTQMTAVQGFGAADLVVQGGLLKLRALAGALGKRA
jgi:beta-phosphoglucomutase-like phosphatase (HAD superfamily)